MIYRFVNPFVSSTITEINTETNEVWHIHKHGKGARVRADRDAAWWLLRMPVDPDLLMDEGL